MSMEVDLLVHLLDLLLDGITGLTGLLQLLLERLKIQNRSIPKAINAIFWRILLFYIFAIFIIGTLLPFIDPNLLKNSKTDIAQSHFTILFDRAGVAFAASVMNAVIFTAIFSAINSAKPTSLKAKISMIYHLKQNGTYLGQF